MKILKRNTLIFALYIERDFKNRNEIDIFLNNTKYKIQEKLEINELKINDDCFLIKDDGIFWECPSKIFYNLFIVLEE